MKTFAYISAVLVFSALIMIPKIPKFYPPKEVLQQRRSIVYQEQKLDRLIDKIEFELVKDSLKIESKKRSKQ